jgi:hypothetical protein
MFIGLLFSLLACVLKTWMNFKGFFNVEKGIRHERERILGGGTLQFLIALGGIVFDVCTLLLLNPYPKYIHNKPSSV